MGVKMDIELRSSGECMEMAEKVGELPTESSRVRIRVKWKGKALNIVFPTVPAEQQWLQWLAHLFEDLSKVESKCLIATLWALWTHKNKKIHGNVV
ncbi:hypothetical protein V6N13_058959 [Hibiscus sabdariffa]